MLGKNLFGLAMVLCVDCVLGCGPAAEQPVAQAGEKVAREGEKAAESWIEGWIRWWREKPPKPPELKQVPNGAKTPIELARAVQRAELKSTIEEKIRACGEKLPEKAQEALEEVVKKSVQAAGDAYERPGGTVDSAWQAARKTAAEEADKQGSALPVRFATCVSGI